jgi:hypothetical protein
MLIDRRAFVRTAALAASMPTLSGLAFGSSSLSPNVEPETVEMDRSLDNLLSEYSFESIQENMQPIRWQPSISALHSIFGILGLITEFRQNVSYADARSCRGHFESLEAGWRPYFTSFCGVQRPSADDNLAWLMGTNQQRNAVGASQYGSRTAAVSLRGDEPGLALAAHLLLGENYNLSARDTAQSLAITRKEYRTQDVDGVSIPAHRYETPSISFVHYPRHRRYPKGSLVVHNKRDRRNPQNLYGAGLYV